MIRRRVVDTNVAIVANGRETNASPGCRLSAIEALRSLLARGRIIIDDGGEMLDEYRRYCEPKGQPGVGDRFFREVLMNYAGRVERISLEKGPEGGFIDFPTDPELAGFDLADRKFAAAARKAAVPVLNAVDSDWLEYRKVLARNKVKVEFVCSRNAAMWFVQ